MMPGNFTVLINNDDGHVIMRGPFFDRKEAEDFMNEVSKSLASDVNEILVVSVVTRIKRLATWVEFKS